MAIVTLAEKYMYWPLERAQKEEIKELRAEIEASVQSWSRFHHLMNKHGWHPGRTDDDLIEVLDAKLTALKQQEPVAVVQRSILLGNNTILQYEGVEHLLKIGSELYLAAGAQPVPEGYQLVPIEPTEAILQATFLNGRKSLHGAYRAMLEAAKDKS